MPQFRYRAKNAEGRTVQGTLEAVNRQRVAADLKERGLAVESLERAGSQRHLSWQALEQLSHRLGMYLGAGAPVAEALAHASKDMDTPRLRSAVEELSREVGSGKSLAEAVGRQPDLFPPPAAALLRAPGVAENPRAAVRSLEEAARSMAQVQQDTFWVLTKPLATVAAIYGAIMAALLIVVPSMETNGSIGISVFSLACTFVWLSGVVQAYWAPIGLVTLGAGAGALYLSRSIVRGRSNGLRIDVWKRRVPFFGRIYRQASMARFAGVLCAAQQAGTPLTKGLEVAGKAAGNALLEEAAAEAAKALEDGASADEALRETGAFDNGFCWLLGNTSRRDDAGRALSAYMKDYERAMARAIWSPSRVLTPVTIIMVCVIVGSVIAILTNLFGGLGGGGG